MNPDLISRISSIIDQADDFAASSETAGLAERFDFILSGMVGVPYAVDPLGREPGADSAPEPLIDLDAVDCVTYIEQGLAIALSRNPDDVPDLLARIRYRRGKIGYLTRNHYFSADWIPSNSWLLEDITGALAGDNAVTITKTINKRKFFEEKGYVFHNRTSSSIPSEKITVTTRIIPPDRLDRVNTLIKAGDIIPITTDTKGIVVRHVGEAAHDDKGGLLLRHASSRARRVIQEPLDEYLVSFASPAGFKVLRLLEHPSVD